jgi:hypothetical protein
LLLSVTLYWLRQMPSLTRRYDTQQNDIQQNDIEQHSDIENISK